jgi:hypothetical protein
MPHSKCPPCSPVNYHPSPRSGVTCSPLTYHLSPRSGASGYQNRVHKNHEYLIICPLCSQLQAFLSDRLSTWGSTARRLCPPLLFTFHLSPGLAQRVIGTLPNPSAHTLAIWQTAHGAIQTRLLSGKRAHTWQTGKLVIPRKHGRFYQIRAIQRDKRHFCMTSNSHLAPVPVHSVWQTSPPHRTGPLARSLARPTLFRSIMKRFGRRPVFLAPAERAAGLWPAALCSSEICSSETCSSEVVFQRFCSSKFALQRKGRRWIFPPLTWA